MTIKAAAVPEVGQAVRVRNRLATVRAVEPYDSRSAQGRLHIIDVEYLDDFRYPEDEQLLWDVEATAEPLGKTDDYKVIVVQKRDLDDPKSCDSICGTSLRRLGGMISWIRSEAEHGGQKYEGRCDDIG